MAKVHRIAVRASTTDEATYRAVSYTKSGGEVKEWVREIDVRFANADGFKLDALLPAEVVQEEGGARRRRSSVQCHGRK